MTATAISHAKLQSNHHHQQTNTQFFLLPFLSPNQQCLSTEGKLSLQITFKHSLFVLKVPLNTNQTTSCRDLALSLYALSLCRCVECIQEGLPGQHGRSTAGHTGQLREQFSAGPGTGHGREQ